MTIEISKLVIKHLIYYTGYFVYDGQTVNQI